MILTCRRRLILFQLQRRRSYLYEGFLLMPHFLRQPPPQQRLRPQLQLKE